MTALPKRLVLLLLVLLAVLALFPAWGPPSFGPKYAFLLQKLTEIMILAILAMGLDLLVGVAGLVSLGHAAFFGLGGYVLALMSPQYEAANVWVVLPAAMGGVALAALVLGFLAIRTAGIYFIMVTLAFGQMGYYFFNDSKLAGGSNGAYIYVAPAVRAFGITLVNLENKQAFFFVVLGCLVAVYLWLRVLLASPFGRVLSAIGVNEGRVRGLGFDPMLYKLVAFTIAGALAGLAGFLAATQYGFVNPAMLGWHQSGHVLVMVILGGMGTLFGPVLGAFILELAHFGLEAVTEHWLLPMGALVIAIVLALPKGVGGLLLQWCDGSSPLPLAGWRIRQGGEQREPGEGPHPPTPAARVPPSPASGQGDKKEGGS